MGGLLLSAFTSSIDSVIMSDFVGGKEIPNEANGAEEEVAVKGPGAENMIDFNSPHTVIYCPTCTMPAEFCEHGACFEKCLPWIVKNCPQVLSDAVLAEMMEGAAIDEDGEGGEGEKKKKKKAGGGAAAPKKATVLDTRVVMTRVQRQKRKFVTVVAGLETVPDLKVKDACKVFGKKFSSGCSVNETQTGAKEVVIQGDVLFDLPAILMNEFKVQASAIFVLEDGATRPFR